FAQRTLESFVRRAFGRATVIACALPSLLSAQQQRSVRGTVHLGGEDTTRIVPNAMVVLHRVGRTVAGPLDSVRSDARGNYSFHYRATADSAVFFVSSMYRGVAYFTPPLAGPDVRGDSADITVFDTTSTGASIATRSRHVIAFARSGNKRQTLA